ncbi:hypothetical protein ACZ90_68045 [Streptomyces albus subsp. albus]|nr:hypothetical protein ACZ90_68045 [Streptomyces albus subsp. albus]
MSEEPIADVAALFDLYQQGIAFHCVCAVTRLGIPDALDREPREVARIATETGCDEDALRRVLRLLAGHGLLAYDPERDLAGLTARGELLQGRHPMSLRATFATLGISDVAHALTETLRTGRPAAGPALGGGFWEYLAVRPEQQTVFSEAMAEQARLLSLPCVHLVDWPSAGTVVDVGGGIGVLLAAVLQEEPGARGILVDQPQVLDRARSFLEDQGVADRCAVRPGNLFEPPPEGDLYLLSRVLHDWDDDSVVRILAAVGEGGAPGARLRVLEDLLPERGAPAPAQSWSDLVMMALYEGARERTLAEYRALLERGGWALERVVHGPPGMNIIEATRA